jgi:hypothetical protein
MSLVYTTADNCEQLIVYCCITSLSAVCESDHQPSSYEFNAYIFATVKSSDLITFLYYLGTPHMIHIDFVFTVMAAGHFCCKGSISLKMALNVSVSYT